MLNKCIQTYVHIQTYAHAREFQTQRATRQTLQNHAVSVVHLPGSKDVPT